MDYKYSADRWTKFMAPITFYNILIFHFKEWMPVYDAIPDEEKKRIRARFDAIDDEWAGYFFEGDDISKDSDDPDDRFDATTGMWAAMDVPMSCAIWDILKEEHVFREVVWKYRFKYQERKF